MQTKHKVIVISGLCCLWGLVFAFGYYFSGTGEDAHTMCRSNLRQVFEALRAYAEVEEDHYFPRLETDSGHFSFVSEGFSPEYLSDLSILRCPTQREGKIEISDVSYYYVGAQIWDEASGTKYLESYRQYVESDGELGFLPAPFRIEHMDEVQTFHLRGTDTWQLDCFNIVMQPQSIIVMIERLGNHKDGAHVVYKDGHVEFVPYPGKFPMTEEFMTVLQEIDTLGEIGVSN